MSTYFIYLMNSVALASGLSGMVMSWRNHRTTKNTKRLDLRIALRKDCEGLKHALSAADRLMREASTSRQNLEGTAYDRGPEERAAWQQRFKADADEVGLILRHCLQRSNSAEKFGERELETGIVDCYASSLRVTDIVGRYEASIDSDVEHVRNVRLMHEEMTRALLR